jgi:hypothetical protein
MAIDDYKHHGLTDETEKTHARQSIRAAYERTYASDGPGAAATLLAKYKISPSAEDIQIASTKATRAEYERLRDLNPFDAADFGRRNPSVHLSEGLGVTQAVQGELDTVVGRAVGTAPTASPAENRFEAAAERVRAAAKVPLMSDVVITPGDSQ